MKKTYLLVIGLILVIVIISIVYYFWRGSSSSAQNITIVQKDLIETVSISGKIVAKKKADLAFEIGGRISWIGVEVGDKVFSGQTLATLDSSEFSSRLAKAEADVETRFLEVEKAEIVLNNYYEKITDIINDAHTKADNAVRQQTEEMFIDDETLSPKLTFPTINSQTEVDLKTKRYLVSETLNLWLEKTNQGSLSDARTRLNIIRNFIDLLNEALVNSVDLKEITIINYKTKINNARVNINSALSAVNDLEQDIATQQKIISEQKSMVKSALATVDEIRNQARKNRLSAPFNGVITSQEAMAGEVAIPNQNLISLIFNDQLEAEAYIPEVYIGQVKVGQTASVSFDAFPGKKINSQVKAIDPAETIVDGVSNFKATFSILQQAENDFLPIKSGLTTIINIETLRKEKVITVSKTALVEKGGSYFVNKVNNNNTELTAVLLGTMTTSGEVEVISGLTSGDIIKK